MEDELISRNVAAVVRLPASRTRKRLWWSVDDARKFLETARQDRDALYAAYVLISPVSIHARPARRRSFDRCIAKAQVPKITVHGTRKTCGSLLAVLDVHPRVAMQILRHSKIAVTMEIYTEVPSQATRDALRKLGAWLES